jgi:hypothetical protein
MQFTHTPLHVTVVGGKRDDAARSLFRAALSAGLAYKRFEWWDPAEGPLPRADIQYPSLAHAAAFLCTASTCSAPITDSRVLAVAFGQVDQGDQLVSLTTGDKKEPVPYGALAPFKINASLIPYCFGLGLN